MKNTDYRSTSQSMMRDVLCLRIYVFPLSTKSVNFIDEALPKPIFNLLAKRRPQKHIPLTELEQFPLDSLVRLSSSSSKAVRVEMCSRCAIQAANALRQSVVMKPWSSVLHFAAPGMVLINSFGASKIALCVASQYWSYAGCEPQCECECNFEKRICLPKGGHHWMSTFEQPQSWAKREGETPLRQSKSDNRIWWNVPVFPLDGLWWIAFDHRVHQPRVSHKTIELALP